MRACTILGAALLLCTAMALPGWADTNCLCANGETTTTTREDSLACESVCELLGGGGQVVTNDDEGDDEGYDEGDENIVVRPRHRGPARPRR